MDIFFHQRRSGNKRSKKKMAFVPTILTALGPDLFAYKLLPFLWWNEISTGVRLVCKAWEKNCRDVQYRANSGSSNDKKKVGYSLRLTTNQLVDHWGERDRYSPLGENGV